MARMPTSQYVEVRNGGYYIAGTRIGLDVIVQEFQQGQSPEGILQHYPSIGSLAKVYGAIAFILEYPKAIEAYLKAQDRLWEELKRRHPLPPGMVERFHRARELSRQSR